MVTFTTQVVPETQIIVLTVKSFHHISSLLMRFLHYYLSSKMISIYFVPLFLINMFPGIPKTSPNICTHYTYRKRVGKKTVLTTFKVHI